MADKGIPVIGPIMHKLIGSRNERFVKRYTTRVEQISALEPKIRQLTDEQIRGMLPELRARHDEGVKTDGLLVEVFAVAREAMDRAVGIRNIFNPEHAGAFDPSRLPDEARGLYEQAKGEIEGLEARPPEGDLLGNTEPIPAWVWHPLPPALYEAVRELYPHSRPPFRSRPFDVQLIGAMVLAGGKIAEMKTGEGKTIVAPLASYLAAVERQQVHVVTVNDYLVQRDRDWTFPFFHALGLTVGAIHPSHMQDEQLKRAMYRCDVVYGTTSEFGFDYLRDNMKRSVEQQVQRKRQFAVVDEVDSILIDEARTPLIIAGAAHDDQPRYDLADGLARHLASKQAQWQALEDQVRGAMERIKGLEGDLRQIRDKAQAPAIQASIKELKASLPGLERQRDEHTQYYEVHMERKQAHLTHEGIAEAQRKAGVGSFFIDANMDLPHLLEQAVRAHVVYELDRDYIVMDVPDRQTGRTDPTIVIVDTFTGRPMIGRQWSDGLHQAIESKEKVPIKEETQTVATVTIQNFYKMYKRLSGMTGTADTEAQEFHDIYKLDVVSIPTNKPVVRHDHADLVFLRAKDKWEAIVDEIKAFHDVGRPVLVGTTSVEKSEMLSQMLTRKHGIKHAVLNAKQHESEAMSIEHAGQLGAVMIATNMAGRGTDIKLGSFTHDELLEHWLRRGLCSRTLTADADKAEVRRNVFRKIAAGELGIKKREAEEADADELEMRLLRHWAYEHTMLSENKIQSMDAEGLRGALDQTGRIIRHRIRWYEGIEDLGGLHVIGTERHESRRIDNQLRGRCGRQGDRGSSRFYVSLEDDLMQMFGGETMMKILPRLGLKEGDHIESGMLSKRIEGAQRKVESRNFEVRKNILEYDEVMEHQRQTFYGLRQRVLEGRDVKGLIFEFLEESISEVCQEYLDKGYPAECAAEFAKDKLECSILPERLRNRDAVEIERFIRTEAKAEARHSIDLTLGEYIPMEGSEVSIDFDSAGLVSWARSSFGIEIDATQIRAGGAAERRQVFDLLTNAAEAKIDATDLTGVEVYLVEGYGAQKLADWAKSRFGIELSSEDILAAQADESTTPLALLLDRIAQVYRTREIEYCVDYAMEMTMAMMREGPAQAAENLVRWANIRFGLDWDADRIKTTPPAKVREQLHEASQRFVDSGRLDSEIADALACGSDDELDAHLTERFGVGITERMRWLEGEEREDAIRARLENILRAELLELERSVLLETLDTAWKDHLYETDQLRDAIGFRRFSQQDPRIAFKRECANQFLTMMSTIRDRVGEYIFKARISPAAIIQQQRQQAAMMAQHQARAQASAGGAAGGQSGGSVSGISGPGFATPQAPPPKGPSRGADSPSDGPAREQGASEKPSPEEALKAAQAARDADRTKQRKR